MHKISFIAQDLSDSRAFGYIYGSPENGHRFFGIKTEKAASQVNFLKNGRAEARASRIIFFLIFENGRSLARGDTHEHKLKTLPMKCFFMWFPYC